GWNEQTHQYCFQIGVPFAGTPPAHIYAGGIKIGSTPSGQAMRVHYTGTEENVIPTYDQMEVAMGAAHLQMGKSFEVYNDDPTGPSGSQNREIYYLFQGDAHLLQQVAPSTGTPPPVGAAAPAAASTTSTDTSTATSAATSTATGTATTAP